MKHEREDYNRIQDPAGLIPENEPVFLIRGQDVLSASAVGAWADLAELEGASPRIVASARRQATLMEKWQAEHGAKIPDMPDTVL